MTTAYDDGRRAALAVMREDGIESVLVGPYTKRAYRALPTEARAWFRDLRGMGHPVVEGSIPSERDEWVRGWLSFVLPAWRAYRIRHKREEYDACRARQDWPDETTRPTA